MEQIKKVVASTHNLHCRNTLHSFLHYPHLQAKGKWVAMAERMNESHKDSSTGTVLKVKVRLL